MRHGRGRLVAVDGDAHELGAGARERRDLRAVASISAVSVLVIDWTTIGAPPPTMTPPILTGMACPRGKLSISGKIQQISDARARGLRRPRRLSPWFHEQIGQKRACEHAGRAAKGGGEIGDAVRG